MWTSEDNLGSLLPQSWGGGVKINHDDINQAVVAHTFGTFSQARFAPVCEAMCLSTTRPTRSTQGTTLWMSGKDLVHLSCPLLFPPHNHSPLPLTSVYLSYPHTLSLSLSPQIGPAVHQPSRSSPSCLPSPNEKPYNNTGHRSRERTGCVHNGPVAPNKTIVPFFSGTLPPLLPGLEKTNLWRGGWGGRGVRGYIPLYLQLSKEHSNTLLLSLFSRCHHGFV